MLITQWWDGGNPFTIYIYYIITLHTLNILQFHFQLYLNKAKYFQSFFKNKKNMKGHLYSS